MSWLVLVAAALAGWSTAGSPEPGQEVLLDVPLGEAALIRVTPERAVVTLTDDGVRVPLTAGPHGTWVVPASDRGRTLTLSADRRIHVDVWEEDDAGEPAAWSRYATQVARWCRGERLLPEPPGELEGLDRVWTERRRAMREMGEDDPDFCIAAAWLELEQVRTRGLADHYSSQFESAPVDVDGVFRTEVQGPGVWVVRAAPLLDPTQEYGPVELSVAVDGVLEETLSRRSGPNPEEPGRGWRRTATVVLPPGIHRVSVVVEEGPVQLDTHVERLRLPLWRSDVFDALYAPQGPVAQMEAAALTRQADVAVLAKDLLHGPAHELAQYRWIATDPDQKAVAIGAAEGLTALGRLAWAHRSAIRQDVLPERLIGEPLDWTVRVDDVAVNLERLEPSAFRPRDAWARRLANAPVPGGATTRWTALEPLITAGVERSESARGGVQRTRIDAGHEALLMVEDDGAGLGRLRLLTEAPTAYRVDGEARYGVGRLDEALPAGVHTITVDRGTAWLLDGDQSTGGVTEREVPVSALPGTWPLPEPGFPARIAISSRQPGQRLSLATDDGRAWQVETVEGYSVIEVGPRASSLVIGGPPDARIAVAMERSIEGPQLAFPDVGDDPIGALRMASQRLVADRDIGPVEEGYLRLLRASALIEMGLSGSARRELSYLSSIADITEGQRALAATTLSAGVDVDEPGPLTPEAALAMAGRLPPTEGTADAWLAAARAVPDALAGPVYARAGELLLAEGRPYEAFAVVADKGDDVDSARSAVLRTGRWRRIQRVETHGGAIRESLEREGPGPDSPPLAHAREAMLGAPWDPSSYAVLRDGRRDRLVFTGGGLLAIDFICQDETVQPDAEDCVATLTLDGEEEVLRIPPGVRRTVKRTLDAREHDVLIDARRSATHALVVRLERNGRVIPPQVDVLAHRVGGGVRTAIAGPALVRVRVPRGGPVTVRLGDQTEVVSEESVLAVLDEGAVSLAVDGPAGAWVSLSQWEALPPDEVPPPIPSAPSYVAPEAIGLLAMTSREWMGEVRRGTRADRRLAGPPGTLRFSGRVENDAVGVRDRSRSYRAAQARVAGLAKLAPHVWIEGRTTGRLSLDGPPSAGIDGRFWRTGSRTWFEVGARGWVTRGASHARLDAEWLQRLAGNVETRADAYIGGFGGLWSRAAPARVDPRAWNRYGKDHPYGLYVGGRLTWRPVLDARIRGSLEAVTNAELSLDRIDADLSAQTYVGHRVLLTGSAELGLRFADRHRARTRLRPLLRASGEWAAWAGPSQRLAIGADMAWLPLGETVEGGIIVTWDVSRRRGLLDYPVARTVFGDLRDYPQENR